MPQAFDKGFRWVTDPSVQAKDKPDNPKESPGPESSSAPAKGPVQGSGAVNKDAVSAWRPTRNEPVINFVDSLIATAVNEGASDIHIEPREKELHVRLRIDGVLFNKPAPPIKMHPAIISRLKILANMDISERRLP
ncbi:MAG: Flp pilus assembly complex ATPase component TadA, partial [Planctomycetes bacterium]|nr:Flp pilus assembly complex ATPase component TadA [Planctomycetota bacterium]